MKKKSRTKLSRRLGIDLTPKARKIMAEKPYPPGEHGPAQKRRAKVSDYKLQLMEKQRLRAQYGLEERQMGNYVRKAIQQHGNPADNLVRLLESRLDAIVYRAGFARTVEAARQYVSHRHIMVDGRWVNLPSQQIRLGQTVSVKEKSRALPVFISAKEEMVAQPPGYLQRNAEDMSVQMLYTPNRAEVPVSCEMLLVIEYYSRR
ncbi:MAG: 30S ribosomal protein S4 [Desulfobacteraceae bacterium]|nr:MAG: 30S ribosomal protein S4 [Desulfobacteraceae bacterium]